MLYQSGFRTNHSTLLFQQTFVLMKTNIFALLKCLQKTSGSRSIYSSWSYVFKTSSRRVQDTLRKRLQDIFKTSSRRFQDGFKTSLKRLAKTSSKRLAKMSSRRLVKTSSRHLQDIVLQRCLQEIFETYYQVKLQNDFKVAQFCNTVSRRLREIFKTFLRRTTKTVIYRRFA